MTTTTPDLAADIDKLKSDLEELRRDVAAIASGIKALGAAKGEEAFARAEARAEEIGERARASLAATEELLGREIEERPIASLLMAFGVGFVIGKLLDPGR